MYQKDVERLAYGELSAYQFNKLSFDEQNNRFLFARFQLALLGAYKPSALFIDKLLKIKSKSTGSGELKKQSQLHAN